jgi:hypothetical protein
MRSLCNPVENALGNPVASARIDAVQQYHSALQKYFEKNFVAAADSFAAVKQISMDGKKMSIVQTIQSWQTGRPSYLFLCFVRMPSRFYIGIGLGAAMSSLR